MFGGNNGQENVNKMYWSKDSEKWLEYITTLLMDGRKGHASVAHNGKTLIIGGYGNVYKDEVFSLGLKNTWLKKSLENPKAKYQIDNLY